MLQVGTQEEHCINNGQLPIDNVRASGELKLNLHNYNNMVILSKQLEGPR